MPVLNRQTTVKVAQDEKQSQLPKVEEAQNKELRALQKTLDEAMKSEDKNSKKTP